MTLEQYINNLIQIYDKALRESESLSNDAIGKDIFIAKERECLRLLNDIKSHMEFLEDIK